MLFSPPFDDDPARRPMREALAVDESQCLQSLVAEAIQSDEGRARIHFHATRLVEGVRARKPPLADMDTFLSEYSLSTREGVMLMCLAEALLRIPDTNTAESLIRDKIGGGDWQRHLGHSGAALVNASTWALMLSGRLVGLDEITGKGGLSAALRALAKRMGEPVVREALVQAMRIMGRQFVMGRTMPEALERARDYERQGYSFSYDMLGEGARGANDAERYFNAYVDAITAIGAASAGRGPIDGPGISVKLSALHPRFSFAQRHILPHELAPRLAELCRLAHQAGIGLTIDAEESDRLEPMLDVFAALFADPGLAGWEGFGLAVQAYQKRAMPLIDWLAGLSASQGRRIMVRLVKGAYWDTEIKRAQERGLSTYPVFTRKSATDVSYLACAHRMLAAGAAFYPQFATHNAHTVAAVAEMAGNRRRTDWEFQRLHGMGDGLYEQVLAEHPCRVYAPVGSHEDLLPYLVRRLLENGANTSFVNRVADRTVPVSEVVADPVVKLESPPQSILPLPAELFGPERRNSQGWDLTDPLSVTRLDAALESAATRIYQAVPIIAGNEILAGPTVNQLSPADLQHVVGRVTLAAPQDAAHAVGIAHTAARNWERLGAERRASILEAAADAFEQNSPELIWLIVAEAGKTIPDAVAEVREAVDFLRYYAAQARALFGSSMTLPGVTGEANTQSLHGRGVFVCISPWNFPLAIFTGQVAAALAAGNAVVAKPAEQTPLIAASATRFLHQAGVPVDVLNLLLGDGRLGAELVGQPGIAGIAFTGSMPTARAIQRVLAKGQGPIIPLIAETGGINAMVVDSSALPEQVVDDVIASAFLSAGQRCSSLRLLLLQDDIHDRIVTLLTEAAAELVIGDPRLLNTDIGPIIDGPSRAALDEHCRLMETHGRMLFRCRLPVSTRGGIFFAPCAIALDRPDSLTKEAFGPILHVVRWKSADLDSVLDAVAANGSGLTLGIHSRIDSFVQHVRDRLPVGNTYVNRSMIGAMVGCQPFGGEGLSGTGPKSGGPHTLLRYATERTLTVNIAAAGGNAALLAMGEG